MVYSVTILVNAKNKEEVERYMYEVFGPAWYEINEFPFGVNEKDLAFDIEAEEEIYDED
jgi:nitrogenase molybdenum-iron protein alpha/beta subunit